jgi:hypothetical protein
VTAALSDPALSGRRYPAIRIVKNTAIVNFPRRTGDITGNGHRHGGILRLLIRTARHEGPLRLCEP